MITYREIEEKDLEQIIRFYEKYLNSGSYIREGIIEGFRNKGYIGIKAEYDGRMVGFISGRSGIDFTYPHPQLEQKIRELSGGGKIYTPDAIVVLPEYRIHGIGHKLIRKMHNKMMKEGHKLALVELWIYPDGTVPAQSPVKEFGTMVFSQKVPMFYKDNQKYQILCPKCGEDCKCGAMIELWDLWEDKGTSDEEEESEV